MAQLGADVRLAAGRVAAAGLGEHGLAADATEPGRHGRELVGHAVGDAVGVLAAVAVEVLMGFVDELALRAVAVHDAGEHRGRVGREAADGVVVGAGEEDHLGCGAGGADGRDGLLEGGGPFAHDDAVGLVHQSENDLFLRGVFLGELGPEAAELVVGRTALADDAAVPASVVVQVEDTVCAGGETRLHDVVVGAEETCVKRTSKIVVDEVLPSDRKTKQVESVILRKVLHLRRSF